MNTQLLKRLYSIYSPSGKELGMMNFLSTYIRTLSSNISLTQDRYGNLYAVKGKNDTYPCLVSHTDQVAHCYHSSDFRAVETRDIIFGLSPGKKRFENLGADDKNGIFICLECLKKYDVLKVVFFREEETGCRGSSQAYMPFFDDVRFVIQPDRKGHSDLITSIGCSELCSEEFLEAVEPGKWVYTEQTGMMTDVQALKENGLGVSCINLSCGYYNSHSDQEITVKKDLQKCLLFVEHVIEDCTDVYPHTWTADYIYSRYETEDDVHDILAGDPTLTAQDLYDMYSTNFPHLDLKDYERICEDHKLFWPEYEETGYDRKQPDIR